jgi:hypothetical protein
MYRGLLGLLGASLLFAAMPASNNYELHNYDYGSGGTSNSSSANYSLNGSTGQAAANTRSSSTSYELGAGNNNTQQAYVPAAPSFTNPDNYYDKLHFVINPGTNPSDTEYSIAISTDNFATTQYVQNDNTVGPTRGIEDYQTYAAWGGAIGQVVTGLLPNTTYAIKVNAIQGSFTETEYGPAATAATVPPSITFDIDVAPTDTETNPPFTVSFGSLLPATTVTAPNKIWIDLDTNADSGAKVYVRSVYAGLHSQARNYTIASAAADLSSANSGYGAQGNSTRQGAGGPLSISSPFNVTGQNVAALTTSLQEVFSSPSPVTAGRGSFALLAKAAALTPASNDYQDTVAVVAAATF